MVASLGDAGRFLDRGGSLAGNEQHPLVAIGLVCLAGILFVVMNTLVKALQPDHHVIVLLWARTFFHVAFVVVVFPRAVMGAIRTAQLPVQLGRSVLLTGSTICNFFALLFLPLGEVSAITFVSPILVAALAAGFLRERVGLTRWLAIGAGFLGVLAIIRPGVGAAVNPGALLAFACACFYAVYQISTRIVREAEPIVSLLFSGLVGAVIFSLAVPFYWDWPSLPHLALFVAIGSLGAVGHLLVIMALQRAEASKVSPFNYVQLVWAMLASFLAFGEIPSPWTALGAVIIVASGLFLYRLDMAERARLQALGAS